MAISNIIKELMDEGYVREAALELNQGTGNPGRKSDHLTLCRERFFALGIYLSRDAVHGILTDIYGKVHDTWHEPLDHEDTSSADRQNQFRTGSENSEKLSRLLDRFATKIKTDMAVKWQKIEPLGLGICSIGPMDVQSGTLLDPPNFYGIEMFDLKHHLAKHF